VLYTSIPALKTPEPVELNAILFNRSPLLVDANSRSELTSGVVVFIPTWEKHQGEKMIQINKLKFFMVVFFMG
jgi:hypothetical protein